MDAKRRLIQVGLVVLGTTATVTFAESGENTFGEAFFVSKRNDGSVEVLGSAVTWLLLLMSTQLSGYSNTLDGGSSLYRGTQ